jgi:muramoyltetrapeptide carboxypeptidase LdcA involved in peptidoglycan recycling
MGLAKLHEAGFETVVHEQVAKQSFTFAANDQERADALWELSTDELIDILWCARGGYGATRLLPILQNLTERDGPPRKKLLVGFSDVTVLHEFVRTAGTGPPCTRRCLGLLSLFICTNQWAAVLRAFTATPPEPWSPHRLEFLATPGPPIPRRWSAHMTLWQVLCGTPWQPSAAGKMLFFEDVGETWYRVDRMVTSLLQARRLKEPGSSPAISKTERREHHGAEGWRQSGKIPLRRSTSARRACRDFGNLADKLKIPIASASPSATGQISGHCRWEQLSPHAGWWAAID